MGRGAALICRTRDSAAATSARAASSSALSLRDNSESVGFSSWARGVSFSTCWENLEKILETLAFSGAQMESVFWNVAKPVVGIFSSIGRERVISERIIKSREQTRRLRFIQSGGMARGKGAAVSWSRKGILLIEGARSLVGGCS